MSDGNIPLFGLYGDSEWSEDPEFLHIEDIESRSSDLGWKIDAHRHGNLFQILILKSGDAKVQLDDKTRRLLGKWAIIVPAGCVHSFRFAPETDGKVLSIAAPLLEEVYQERAAKLIKPLLQTPTFIDLGLNTNQFNELWPIVMQIERETSIARSGRALMGEYLVKALLIMLHRYVEVSVSTNSDNHNLQLLQDLKELIEQNYLKHWSTPEYSKRLNTSEKTLNRLTKSVFNQSVKSLCHQRLFLEAKRRLIYSRKTIEEIAYDLGFIDPGYFSRFFKRLSRYTPGQFRLMNQQN
ncbi:helix-turn-helix domain-containing protein [Marinomonas mediterranea]|uniref:Transcriptional regulator, AraC family n=1 Tax=Marinomonas mediterranea (strain ATCC 700492 / JCM 21426 / NBRC 103028 / MMB-1) TaxID=717774 RepID=F2JUE8_MARM1|nr:helix-turn-helix domain-containing protein [Marinomonas mediterranea]ADZ92767.1 transcriptional regulator, AraC family [Marinomonas mediterranea MMB-1]WCN18794.1 helix-turn-helix domain-containing protein [Marinomonas mediterranea MMB-1]